ncbi:hypothetical protein [Rhabdothermincola sediminis]|uniref:hypothetical protein n=1 Tax=Rhabdothermincola sediminis TaxID=2751370 RepID=UPI001AA08EA5|nr:hypothetical protein [Rhabdothermincola sediminis]
MTETIDAPDRSTHVEDDLDDFPEDDESRGGRRYYAEILLMCFASLLLEVSYTRIVSFKLYYYYTFLVIGLSLLGLGTGGVIVAISRRLRRTPTDTVMTGGLLVAGLSVLVGFVVVARTPIDSLIIWDYGTRASVGNLALLIVICLALFASFVAIGVMISTLFGRRASDVGRLYFADLLGAGLACASVVFLLLWIGPVTTILLAGLILSLTGLRLAWRRGLALRMAGMTLSGVFALGVLAPSLVPKVRADSTKAHHYESDLFSRWGAIFRVDAYEVSPDARLLLHDGMLGSAVHRWDGDPSTLGRFDRDPRRFPFATSGTTRDNVMIIGAAGGNEVLASLHFGAEQIDAIELNPVTYSLVTDEFADYSGHLAENPKVNYVNGDGRSFLKRSSGDYDLIWYPAPDSYAATNAASSGAFVLSESYLYTTETIEESLAHLTPDGVVAAQFGEINFEAKPNRTTRYVSTARRALENSGVDDPGRHLLVITSPTEGPGALSTILVKREPFSDQEVADILASMDAVPGAVLRYAPGHPVEGETATIVATASPAELEAWYASYPYDMRPITDNGPFFWHFTPFSTVLKHFGDPINPYDTEDSVGERVLLLLLAIAVVLGAVFLLLPFVTVRRIWSTLPRKATSAVYFLALGMGFMFFEVSLIQRLVLFLGFPTYSLTVTLASILLSTGVGALLSERVAGRAQRMIVPLLVALGVLTAFYLVGLPAITDALLGWPLVGRVLVALALLAPLGLCLGMFMPLGLRAVAGMTDHPREYVAWGWAVNGFASVAGAVLTTILGMMFGFDLVLVLAFVVYVGALASLRALTGAAEAAA